MPKNWKYIKKLLEKEFLCEKLRGHITYDLTDYRPAPWYQQHFIMKYDDEVLLDVTQPKCTWDKRYRYPPTRWDHIQELGKKECCKWDFAEYGIPEHKLVSFASAVTENVLHHMAHYDGVYGVEEIIEAIGDYLHSDIKKNLHSEEYFICALAVLDRRCGKRTLTEMAQWKYQGNPGWLRRILRLRFEAEGIRYSDAYR